MRIEISVSLLPWRPRVGRFATTGLPACLPPRPACTHLAPPPPPACYCLLLPACLPSWPACTHLAPPPGRLQVLALSARRGRTALRHPLLISLNFVSSCLVALGIGAVYWKTGRDTGGIQVGGAGSRVQGPGRGGRVQGPANVAGSRSVTRSRVQECDQVQGPGRGPGSRVQECDQVQGPGDPVSR